MENIVNELVNSSTDLCSRIRKYLLSNENWLYYFIVNKKVFDLLAIHTDDWKDYAYLEIESICGSTIKVRLILENEDNGCEDVLKSTLYLYNFERQVEMNYKAFHEKDLLTEEIKKKEAELYYFENKIRQTQRDLEVLKERQTKNSKTI